MSALKKLRNELKKLANPEKAAVLQRFFKTGKGQYGEGDKFLGIVVPQQRSVAKKFLALDFDDLENLLASPIHEERLIALLILVMQNQKADAIKQQAIFDFYITNAHRINNWDLVDLSAPHIVGKHLFAKDKQLLYDFAQDENLWRRRIAIIATQYFIRNDCFKDTIALAKMLLNDQEDLMHKASGWMLREVGKRDVVVLEKFLDRHVTKMPRTMLRYAIERFPEAKRKAYLGK
jgi:3-methyladenine DNA glycosylase AlkD